MKVVAGMAKAVAPAVVTLLGAIGYSLSAGRVDTQSLLIAGVGLLGSVITYFVPNAAPEVQAVETVFSPVAAGHPDPEPAPAVLKAVVAPPSPEITPPAPALPTPPPAA